MEYKKTMTIIHYNIKHRNTFTDNKTERWVNEYRVQRTSETSLSLSSSYSLYQPFCQPKVIPTITTYSKTFYLALQNILLYSWSLFIVCCLFASQNFLYNMHTRRHALITNVSAENTCCYKRFLSQSNRIEKERNCVRKRLYTVHSTQVCDIFSSIILNVENIVSTVKRDNSVLCTILDSTYFSE